MIDQQKGTEEGASGDDLGAPFSLPALSKSALTHPPQAGDVLPPAVVRSPGGGRPAEQSFPAQYGQASRLHRRLRHRSELR